MRALILSILLVFLALFALALNPPQADYLGFQPLAWSSLGDCLADEQSGAVAARGGDKAVFNSPCQSEQFESRSSSFELHYKRSAQTTFYLELHEEGLAPRVLKLKAPKPDKNAEWHRYRGKLSKNNSTASFKVRRKSGHAPVGNLELSSRVDFFAPLSTSQRLRKTLSSDQVQPAIAIALAFLLIVFVARAESRQTFFWFCLGSSLLIQFRAAPFFYWDEWDMLQRLTANGFSAAFTAHNEHFIPFFLVLFRAEQLLFGEFYQGFLCLSALIHGLNAYLLYLLLERLTTPRSFVSQALAVVYLASAAHSSILQQAVGQCALLSQTAALVAFIYGIDFLKTGDRKNLLIAAVGIFAAPLFFGNGFAEGGKLMLLGLSSLFFLKEKPTRSRRATLLVVVFFAAAASGALFYMNRHGAGHGVEAAKPFENVQALSDYVFVGSEFGTVLRGVSLFPDYDLRAANDYVLRDLIKARSPELKMAWVGFGLSILMLLVALWRREDKKRVLVLWTVGQVFIISTFLLPALGRWQLGAIQALSPRYQCAAMIGLMLMLVALFEDRKHALSIFAWLAIAVQLVVAADFSYFTDNGARNRVYVEQLKEYRALEQNAQNNATEPLAPPHLIPGSDPNRLTTILDKLS